DRPSNIGACNTASWPLNINPTDEANAPLIYAAISAKCSDDGHRPTSSHLRLPLQITAFGIFLVRFEQLLLGRERTVSFMPIRPSLTLG
ncbi:hypothetical protein, partial [Sphingorhabdus sp.]|uniref:hypothetical protein n=1 Tax=Sphingorhabdus sp. TaxID=1902408 RepID=UPI0037C58EFE